jgi:hypothetical protein
LRPDPITGFEAGFFFPGRSSEEGGMEEFPLLRPTIRSNATTRSTNRAFAAVNSSITTSRDTHDPHPGAGGGSITAA